MVAKIIRRLYLVFIRFSFIGDNKIYVPIKPMIIPIMFPNLSCLLNIIIPKMSVKKGVKLFSMPANED